MITSLEVVPTPKVALKVMEPLLIISTLIAKRLSHASSPPVQAGATGLNVTSELSVCPLVNVPVCKIVPVLLNRTIATCACKPTFAISIWISTVYVPESNQSSEFGLPAGVINESVLVVVGGRETAIPVSVPVPTDIS